MFVNGKQIVQAACLGHYAVGAFTIYNMEWAQAVLLAAQEERSPVILGVSETSAAYMGGFRATAAMVDGLITGLGITVPVALHLDHGSAEAALACLESGFSSVMYDGSKVPLSQNLQITSEIVAKAHTCGISVEAEVGAIAGIEDGHITERGEIADPAVCAAVAATGIDFLAAGIGNIHGAYPDSWQGLDFASLEAIRKATGGIPLVLHGGSGIPEEQIRRAISMGVAKINVNTECQQAWAGARRSYITSGQDLQNRGHDPVRMLSPARAAIAQAVKSKMQLFGSAGQA